MGEEGKSGLKRKEGGCMVKNTAKGKEDGSMVRNTV